MHLFSCNICFYIVDVVLKTYLAHWPVYHVILEAVVIRSGLSTTGTAALSWSLLSISPTAGYFNFLSSNFETYLLSGLNEKFLGQNFSFSWSLCTKVLHQKESSGLYTMLPVWTWIEILVLSLSSGREGSFEKASCSARVRGESPQHTTPHGDWPHKETVSLFPLYIKIFIFLSYLCYILGQSWLG